MIYGAPLYGWFKKKKKLSRKINSLNNINLGCIILGERQWVSNKFFKETLFI